eukprot:2399665-Amphidinium_carterae.2
MGRTRFATRAALVAAESHCRHSHDRTPDACSLPPCGDHGNPIRSQFDSVTNVVKEVLERQVHMIN